MIAVPEEALRPWTPETERRSALQLPEYVCDVFLLLMASLFILYFDQNGLGKISVAKRNCFFTLTGLYLGALLLAVLTVLIHPDTQEAAIYELRARLRRTSVVCYALLAYLALTLISALLSEHTEEVWIGATRNEGVVTQMLYVLIVCTLALFARPKRWQLYVLGATMIVFTVISVLQIIGGDPLSLYPSGRTYENLEGRYLGTIGNVDHIAGMLCVFIPLFAVTLIRGSGKSRFVLALPLGATLLLLLLISVLGGFVGIAVGGVLAVPFVLRFSAKSTKWYFIGLAALGVLGLAGLYVVDIGDGMFHEMHEILHGNFDDRFGSGRIFIWRQVLERIPARFWFGYGPDTMRLENLEPFTRVIEGQAEPKVAHIDTAHNEYLNILFHQGIFALAAFMTAIVVALVHYFRDAKRNVAVAVFGTGVLCHCVDALFGISQPITTPFFWIAVGLLEASFARPADAPESSSPSYIGRWQQPEGADAEAALQPTPAEDNTLS